MNEKARGFQKKLENLERSLVYDESQARAIAERIKNRYLSALTDLLAALKKFSSF